MNSKKTYTFLILASFLGIIVAYGLTSSIAFVVSRVTPEVVILDPYIDYGPYVSRGGPEPELTNGAELNPEQDDIPEHHYFVNGEVEFPKTYSKSLVVADLDSGEIIASKNEDQLLPIASITKLMTALVAEELIQKDETLIVSRSAVSTYGQQGRLSAGEKYTFEEILYPLLLESSNDAAEVLAEHVGRNYFLQKMNEKARSIGLLYTNFADPSGLIKTNKSTASELFDLTRYIHQYRDYIFDITQEKSYTDGYKTWYNNSRFKNDKYYIGGKNGFTDEAQKTLIALFQLPLEGENGYRNIAIILLNSADTTKDTKAIINFLIKYVEYK